MTQVKVLQDYRAEVLHLGRHIYIGTTLIRTTIHSKVRHKEYLLVPVDHYICIRTTQILTTIHLEVGRKEFHLLVDVTRIVNGDLGLHMIMIFKMLTCFFLIASLMLCSSVDIPGIFRDPVSAAAAPCDSNSRDNGARIFGPLPSGDYFENLTVIIYRPLCVNTEVVFYYKNGYAAKVNPYLGIRLLQDRLEATGLAAANVLARGLVDSLYKRTTINFRWPETNINHYHPDYASSP
ncbi:envelope glycoprotein L [Gallid alphaherpesvirus 1]|uniref:UL1 protein n=1 Tax=Infectious laryngotracheitis virus TaxID=10386 RepID=G3CFC5_ILTV|nr:UL1 protein [Gallid alphaherpesvirus 1]AFD36685.1 UL1 protein [Gallid alphaherpesvirus 1]AFM36270.1 UL1 protein [Gallid alphaherpesvirus 1]AFM36427.1 UL1 protein [Gallid alphaherpesvirus 1]AFM36505.1 UL1 protein [Gallid alphaherpesvirus 1]